MRNSNIIFRLFLSFTFQICIHWDKIGNIKYFSLCVQLKLYEFIVIIGQRYLCKIEILLHIFKRILIIWSRNQPFGILKLIRKLQHMTIRTLRICKAVFVSYLLKLTGKKVHCIASLLFCLKQFYKIINTDITSANFRQSIRLILVLNQ